MTFSEAHAKAISKLKEEFAEMILVLEDESVWNSDYREYTTRRDRFTEALKSVWRLKECADLFEE